MKKMLGCVVLMFGLMIATPDAAWSQKKPAAKKAAATATPEQYALLAKYTEMVGTVQSVDADSVVLRVEYDHPTANNGAGNPKPGNVNPRPNNNNNNQANHIQRQLQKLQHDKAALQNVKNPAQLQQKMIQIAREEQALHLQIYRMQVQQAQHQQQQMMTAMKNQNGKTQMAKDFIDFDIPLMSKAVVRKLQLGVEFDDKGNAKEPNPAAKGAGNLPGYAAKIDELANGTQVKVYLSPPKASAPIAPKKDENGALLNDPALASRPQIRMVVMLSDPNTFPAAANKKQK